MRTRTALIILLLLLAVPLFGGNKIKWYYTAGQQLCFVVVDSSGQVWDTNSSSFKANPDWNYRGVDFNENVYMPTAYLATCPGLAAGTYDIVIYDSNATALDINDTALTGFELNWDSSSDVTLYSAQSTITSAISGLNNLSVSEVNECMGNKLEDYNSPTKIELDTAQAAIQSDIADANGNIMGEVGGLNGDAMRGTDDALPAASYTEPNNTGIAAIQAKTDQFTFTGSDVNATLDGEKVTLDPNGLNYVSITEPSGDPNTWDFRDWMFWLPKIRFGGKTTCDPDWLKSYTEEDAVLTKQAVNDDGTTQTVGKVQAP